MPSPPTERQTQIALFLSAESAKRGSLPTQREIAERFGFASLNSVRSHLRLMEKKGMLDRLPGKARGLKLKQRPPTGIPIVGEIAAGPPRTTLQEADGIIPASPDLFCGSDLFALRIRGESMRNAGILPGDIAIMNRQPDVANGEIAAVLLEDETTLKYLYRRPESVILRGANPMFPDIEIPAHSTRSIQILGKYVGLIRQHRSAR